MTTGKIVLIIVVFFMACGNKSTDTSEKEQQVISKEKPLIERFSFEDTEGNEVNISESKGKIVFLNFWATWCKPCIEEMPSINLAYNKLKDKGVVFIVASDEEPEKLKKFASKYNFDFTLIHSRISVFELNIKALPTTMIIDTKGEIVFNEVGSRDWSSESNIDLIQSFSITK